VSEHLNFGNKKNQIEGQMVSFTTLSNSKVKWKTSRNSNKVKKCKSQSADPLAGGLCVERSSVFEHLYVENSLLCQARLPWWLASVGLKSASSPQPHPPYFLHPWSCVVAHPLLSLDGLPTVQPHWLKVTTFWKECEEMKPPLFKK